MAGQILSWIHHRSNHQPCGSRSCTLTTTLEAANVMPKLGCWAPGIHERGCTLLALFDSAAVDVRCFYFMVLYCSV